MEIIIIVAVIFIIYKVISGSKAKSQMSNADVKASQQSAIPRQPILRSNPHRILICDDAAFMRTQLKDILTQDGYKVVAEAQNGLEAIERYSEFKPDLVFMDITMPTMDGIDATRKIKEMDSHANIVVCSAMGQRELVMEAIRLGAKDFIVKPFGKEAILQAVVKIFEPWRTATSPKETEQSQNVDTTTAPPVQAQYKQKKSGHKENEQIQTKSYIDALREQYEQYGDFALLEGKICAFIKNHKYYNVTANKVREDLEKIVKWNKLKNELATIDNTQSYLNALKLFCTEFGSNMSSLDMRMNFVKDYQLDTKFQIDSMAVREDIIHMISEPQKFLIGNNRQLYLELLKYYYESYGDAMFYSSEIEKFESTCSKHNLNIQSYDIAEDLRTIRKEEKNTSKLNYNESIMPPVQKQHVQNQTASQMPPVHTQNKQSRTEDTTTTQSVLDTQRLFSYVKAMPVKWEYANPSVSPNKELQQLCNSLLTGMDISKCYNPDAWKGMEYIIQKKRARTPDKPSYNKAMETNMLFEIYEYSYCMNALNVLMDRKNDTVKVNASELIKLIDEDCHKRLRNLEYEKRNNPALQDMLQKYQYDTQKVKMVVNDYVDAREYDYIYTYLMTTTLLNIINGVLNTEMETADGYQPTLKIVRQHPASDLMAALHIYIFRCRYCF